VDHSVLTLNFVRRLGDELTWRLLSQHVFLAMTVGELVRWIRLTEAKLKT
jgi:hypothetical protein